MTVSQRKNLSLSPIALINTKISSELVLVSNYIIIKWLYTSYNRWRINILRNTVTDHSFSFSIDGINVPYQTRWLTSFIPSYPWIGGRILAYRDFTCIYAERLNFSAFATDQELSSRVATPFLNTRLYTDCSANNTMQNGRSEVHFVYTLLIILCVHQSLLIWW
jgi:hypothetical protein